MTWLALGALAKRVITSVITFLRHASFWQLVALALSAMLLLQTVRLHAEQRHAHKLQTQLEKVVAARAADRKAYQDAQAQAAAKNQSDIARTEQRQKEISDARVADLNSRLERISRELRDNPSVKGSAGRTPLPETGPAPCRAYDPAWLCLSPADRLRAAENEQRHDSLIDWVEQQSKLDPNK